MKNTTLLVISILSATAAQSNAITVFSGSGAAPGDIQGTVDAFRAALGTLNPNTPASFAGGRREINWDGVPDGSSDPNAFPGNFFNGVTPGRARGIEFNTPGTGFLVSARAASGQPVAFGFPGDFTPFSPERMFSPAGSVITGVRFFRPGTTEPATVNGLGIVFNDVEDTGVTTLELLDKNGAVLSSETVEIGPNAGLSFLGILLDGPWAASARVTTGDAALISNGVYGPGSDGVVMDDFIFGEPHVPEAGSSLLILSLGFLATVGTRRLKH